MTEQNRASFRVDTSFEAELFHQGRVVGCTVVNLSAGGARVETALEMRAGAQCTLGLALDRELAAATGMTYVSFHMEVLAAEPLRDGQLVYRLHNATGSTSPEYETATKLVFAAQRRMRAAASGAEGSSPMVSDHERRVKHRSKLRTRFGRGSLRPGSDED